MNHYDSNKHNIIKYIKDGEKQQHGLTIGFELEHIVVHKQSLRSITYEEEKGIKYILEQLCKKGWQNTIEGKGVKNLVKNGDGITLEPGAQLEISIENCASLKELEQRYFNFLNDIIPIIEDNDYYLLCMGYHPLSKIEDIPFIPKERYKWMSEYLKTKGTHAHNMMKGTASLQVSVDYTNQEDYMKKNRVTNFLSPAISYLFDNTPIFEGEIWQYNIARVNIWNHVDEDRCRLIPKVLDKLFNYDDYAEYVLNRPCVIALVENNYIYTKDQLVKDIYHEQQITDKEVEHILSMFFPDVRTKKFIEIRMADSVPYPYNIALAALWKGLLYDEDQLDYFYNLSLSYANADIQEIKDDIIVGKDTTILVIDDLIEDILQKAHLGLEDDEKQYLDPLMELNRYHKNLSLKIKNEMQSELLASIIDNVRSKIYCL